MTEAQAQRCVIKWSQQPSIRRKWPELKYLLHIANERKDPKEISMLAALGVKKGVPDLFLPVSRGQYHGLWIEMKNETGRASDEQKWWIAELNAQGYFAEICHGWESAVRVIEWFMDLRKPQ